jgi:hypothetical protein
MSQSVTATNLNPDTISNLFEERDRQPLQEDASPSSNALQKQAAPTLPSSSQWWSLFARQFFDLI